MAKDKRTSVYFDRDKLHFVGLSDAQMQQLRAAYKGIDVDQELKKMGLWLCSSKGKRRSGNIGFILHWLNNTSPVETRPTLKLDEYNSSLRPHLDEYLQDLWKGKEHIFQFNTLRRTS